MEEHPPNTLEIDGEYFAMEGQPLEAYFAMSDTPSVILTDGEGYSKARSRKEDRSGTFPNEKRNPKVPFV